MIQHMGRLFSRAALIVAISYAALIVVLLIATWHVSDLEGRSFDLLFIGFPWVLVFQDDKRYYLALAMNVTTVYILVLSVVRVFTDNSN